MNFQTSKNLAGAGAILLFISPFAFVGTFFAIGGVALLGIILLLIGAHSLAEYYREAGIFNNMLYGTIVGIVAGFASAAALVWATIVVLLPKITNLFEKMFPTWNGDWQNPPTGSPTGNLGNLTASDVAPFFSIILAAILAAFIIAVAVTLLFRKSLAQLSAKSGVNLFGATATVLLIGAALTIVLIGWLLVWICLLLMSIAFFQMRQTQLSQYAASPSGTKV
jgi:uncharacterized membrane protein